MDMWFLSIALGNNLAGQLATEYDAGNLASLSALFLKIFAWGAVGGRHHAGAECAAAHGRLEVVAHPWRELRDVACASA
jgi:hypothetical protein